MHALRLGVCVSLLVTVACDDASKDDTSAASKTAESKDGDDAPTSDKAESKAASGKASVTLADREQRPAAPKTDAAGQTIDGPTRGPIAWRAPAHWTQQRDSGKPFILGEYGLPGHTEETPAMCRLVSNSAKPNGDAPAKQADREVRRTRIRTPEGKSVLSLLKPTVDTIGGKPWHFVMVEGSYRPVKGFKVGTDVKTLVAGYAQINVVPEIPGALFYVRCWGPAATIKAEEPAIRSWVEAIEYPAT